MTPQREVYELSIKLGEGFRSWSEKVICIQFVKENPGSLWSSNFPNILIHKKNPLIMVISCYTLNTCIEMGAPHSSLGQGFPGPMYSRFGQNYFVTFTKINSPAIV
ncbi:hypothetical protein H310_15217 [Aphanomyces invadans]|uniref:Uncharacterized protein n=1 Tax=Aphanomyces invadans TaxID=157072 RepID=A0A024T7T2_9STRA|nr:hypothetical protein H310_15217 [Aphanomyces invadans]ETV89943.1 hypothetical protein H310_15217 [Aphanomyces invadans]|eukprot:XP_008881427.1 hypothetical protein H310_15217 [Aphanomyces invadans]